jgi:hypothetical protein
LALIASRLSPLKFQVCILNVVSHPAVLLIVPSFTSICKQKPQNNCAGRRTSSSLLSVRQPDLPLSCQTINPRHYLAAPTDRRRSTQITQTNPTKIHLCYHDLTIHLDMTAQKTMKEK